MMLLLFVLYVGFVGCAISLYGIRYCVLLLVCVCLIVVVVVVVFDCCCV